MTDNDRIFIQIAAYRDPELVPTVLDCIAKAKRPDNLRISICWQYAEGDSIAQIAHLPQVKFIAVPYNESQGACWARTIACQLYDGEEFYLQIDSHHRFADHWDDKLIEMLEALEKDGVKKPLLTSYPPSYDPKNDPAGRSTGAVQIDFQMFSETCVFTVGSSQIKNWDKISKPIRGRFYAGGFAFARGQFIVDVPYDPAFYFQGEEMALSFRSFSHGYDIYHPHQPLIWHQYYRSDIPKHWKDHVQTPDQKAAIKETWDVRNNLSLKRLKHFFSYGGYRYEDIDWGKYGRGKDRSLRDYELFAGIDFRQKRITRECLNKAEPASTWNRDISDADWDKSLLKMYEHTIELFSGMLPLDDYDFIYVGYDRADGTNIHCRNIKDDHLKSLVDGLKKPNTVVPLVSHFFAEDMPKRWAFWPHSKSAGWQIRIAAGFPKVVY